MEIKTIIKFIQSKIGKLQKDQKVAFGSTKYKYFDLEQLLDKLTPILEEKDCVLIQPMVVKDGRTVLETRVIGKDGVMMESAMVLPENAKPQELGSAITYYRRYSIVSMFGLQAEDDDGNKAHGRDLDF